MKMDRNVMIFKAAELAAIAHRNQLRKGTDIPYISHPLAVGVILARAGASDEAITAGILHDTVEDSYLELADIEAQFGKRVADIVRDCSEPDKTLPWKARKTHTLNTIPVLDRDSWMVVCADKLHNAATMMENYIITGDDLWTRFRAGRQEQEWYFKGIITALRDRCEYAPELFSSLEDIVCKLFP